MAEGADSVVSLEGLIGRLRRSRRLKLILFLSPGLTVLIIFFFSPFIFSLLFSLGMFTKTVVDGVSRWVFIPYPELEYYSSFLTSKSTLNSVFQSIYYASVTTLGTLLLSFPMAYYMALKMDRGTKNIALFLIFLPFWINFLIRVYAIKFIIHPDGPLSFLLVSIGVLDEGLRILGTDIAVLITMVYSYMIFMLLPVYGVMEKLNREYIEAAYTLGATPLKTLLRVTIPIVKPGIIAGSLLVFIPAMGEFIIPIMVGGGRSYPIGRLIYDQFIRIGPPLGFAYGSAAAMVYIVLIVVSTYLYFRFVGGEVRLV